MPLVELDPLEVCAGSPLGPRRSPVPAAPCADGRPPRAVLEGLLTEAVTAGGRVQVAFSGGRDSSVILALATHVARRHGVADPVPLTARYANVRATHETEWQDAVVRHLGLREWTQFEVGTQLDAVGELAASALRRHGLYWPSIAHSMLLLGRKAGSGTLLTGSGGDELFNVWSGHRPSYRRLVRVRPRKRAAKHLALRALPAPTAHAIRARRQAFPVAWLRPDAQAAVDELRRASFEYVRTWGDALRGLHGSRYYELVRTVLDAFAADEGVRLVEPLLDPRVVRALAEHGPRRGFADRGLALEALFGDLLPREILYRTTKATFNEVSWGPEARRFAENWDGTGVDPELVDVERLAAEWARPAPDVRAVACLQQAWLASQ